ncbi:MAG: hypothetical protein HYZ35_07470, partial [Chloroflexi bacterium]|nr:hypothetical protein [Chloroflexota bacterium]
SPADDWLTRLRAQDENRPQADSSRPPTAPFAQPAPLDTDFLRARLGDSVPPPTGLDTPAPGTGGRPSAPTGPQEAALESQAEELPDWLKSFRQPEAEEPAPAAQIPDWLEQPQEAAPEPQADALPDWLQSFGAPAASAAPEPSTGGWPSAPTPPPEAAALPDWLNTSSRPEPAAPAAPVESAPIEQSDAPLGDWLNSLKPTGAPPPPPPPQTGSLTFESSGSDMDYLGSAGASQPAGGASTELPAWLAALRPTGLDTPAAAPAPLPAAPFVSTAPEQSPPSAFFADDLPDWLQTSGAAMGAKAQADRMATPPSAASAPSPTQPNALPQYGSTEPSQWLAALRTPGLGAAQFDHDREESAGPLTGMRGVLTAESVISLVGKPGASVVRFVVTDQQSKQAEVFRTILSEETTTEAAAARAGRRFRFTYPVDRLLVALALFAVALAPYFFPALASPTLLPPPSALSPALQGFVTTLGNLPVDKPVLVAFEYDPASAGELNPGVQAMLTQLMRAGVRVAAISTRPAGVGVAQEALDEAAAETGAADRYGEAFINLGYLPGGIIGLQQFAAAPQQSILFDYRQTGSPWARPWLNGVNSVRDFSLVVVAAASAESAQAWLEQVQPSTGVPLAAIASAAAEPLLYPYYQSNPPQLSGLVSGWAEAAAYDNATGRAALLAGRDPALALRWPSYALGLLASGLIIAIGAVVSTALILSERRPARRDTPLPPKAPPVVGLVRRGPQNPEAAPGEAASKPAAKPKNK